MTATKTSKRNIPGLPNVGRRIVTKESIRAAAFTSQIESDVETFRRLSLQMKELRDELEAVRGRLLHTMQSGQTRCMYTTDKAFVISIRERASWTYSDTLQDELDMLKAKQQIEQRKGIAINNPTIYIDGRSVAS
jgi:hypothetical protein